MIARWQNDEQNEDQMVTNDNQNDNLIIKMITRWQSDKQNEDKMITNYNQTEDMITNNDNKMTKW